MSKHGHRISWFEIPVTDLEKSAALYSKALGVEIKREVLFCASPARHAHEPL